MGVYQAAFPKQPLLWKQKAFSWLCRNSAEHHGLILNSLLVVGDSDCELQAGRLVSRSLSFKRYKQAKIIGNTPLIIAKQLLSLKRQLSIIARSQEDQELLLFEDKVTTASF